jgi:hypothetical protein
MKMRTTLFSLLATSGLVAAAMTACGSDAPIISTPSVGGGNAAGGFAPGQGGASSTGATNNGGATGGATSLPGFQILAGGYVQSGTWHGYAWTAAVTASDAVGGQTTTIQTVPPSTATPPNFSQVAAGATELCVTGSVGAATLYGGVAMLGVNVNQAQLADGGDPPVLTAATAGTGLTVKYTNSGSSVLRVQIQTATGENDPTGRWCATLSGAGGTETLTWDMFWGGSSDTTQGCWNSGGTHPAVGTQIQNVSLLVPGGNVNAVPFSFCMQGITQAG